MGASTRRLSYPIFQGAKMGAGASASVEGLQKASKDEIAVIVGGLDAETNAKILAALSEAKESKKEEAKAAEDKEEAKKTEKEEAKEVEEKEEATEPKKEEVRAAEEK